MNRRGGPWQLHFKPRKPISLGAMALHHIIDADLASAQEWPGKWHVPDGVGYLVGHHVDFDWQAIGAPKHIKRICTLALARKAYPTLETHALGALIYHLYPQPMARDLLRRSHEAAIDVDLCGRVLYSLLDSFGKPESWEKLWKLSEEARVPTRFTFGKYGPKDGKLGSPIAEVRRADPGYVRWCLANADLVKNDPYWQKALTA